MAVETTRGARTASTGKVNNNAQGWGVAAFIVVLAILSNLFIYTVHKRTYKNPIDPTYVNAPER